MSGVKRTFKKVGNTIIIKNKIEDTTLTPKDLLSDIANLKGSLDTLAGQVVKMKAEIEKNQDGIKLLEEERIPQVKQDIKDACKFEEWAITLQFIKLNSIMKDIKDECFNQVTAGYTTDKALTDEHNGLQKYKQLQQKIATHPEVFGNIAQAVITKYIFEDSIVDNPF